nr:hypothetical protein [Tanacetum cinerariifolium]
MQKIINEQVKEQVKVQVSKILPKIEQTVNEQQEAKVLTRSSNSLKTSYAIAIDLFEMELKKILIEKMEDNKEPKLGRSCMRVLGAVVGGVGACCVVVRVAMVEGVIVSADMGRGATKVRVCTSISEVVSKIDSIPASGVGLSILVINCDDTDELCC